MVSNADQLFINGSLTYFYISLISIIDEMEADSIAASQISKSVYSNDSINENTVQMNMKSKEDNSESYCVAAVREKDHDSSESEGSDGKKVSKI